MEGNVVRKSTNDVQEEQFKEQLNSVDKIVDLTKHNGVEDKIIRDVGLKKLLKQALIICRTYGGVYFVSFMMSAWVANRMFDFSVYNPSSNSWFCPFNELCVVFTSIIMFYVIASMFWKYMFIKVDTVDNAKDIEFLKKIWWMRLIYFGILGFFTYIVWRDCSSYEGGVQFSAFVSVVFGAQLIMFVACEIFLQKIYRDIDRY